MRRLLINAAMIPAGGLWRYTNINPEFARAWLRYAPFESFVGYPQTAEFLQQLSGMHVPLNRAKVENVGIGDELLVCKLAYRVDNPATKGQPVMEDWEFGILRRIE